MSSVVKRPRGWEIRESLRTERGPRSRTLATFTRLDEATIEHACARASRPLDRTALIKTALRVGAPVDATPADESAQALIRQLESGAAPRPALRRLIAGYLGDEPDPSAAAKEAAGWLGSSMTERGAALVDLLLLGDAIPVARRQQELSFPGFRKG
jgi:hypothetical protein